MNEHGTNPRHSVAAERRPTVALWWLAVTNALIAVCAGLAGGAGVLIPTIAMTLVAFALGVGLYRQRQSMVEASVRRVLGEQPDTKPLLFALRDRVVELTVVGKEAEAEHGRLEAILKSMTEGVIAVDENETVVLANEASGCAMETNPEDAIGRPVREVIRSLAIHELIRTALDERCVISVESELPRSSQIVAVKADPVGDAAGGCVLTLHDVTEFRRLERVRSEFVANASHELKTPLTVIQLCNDTLQNGAVADPVAREGLIERIDQQCARLEEMIRDMLVLSRAESGQRPPEKQRLDVVAVVAACVRDRSQMADSNRITLELTTECEELSVRSDRVGLRTVIGNLIDNALKYTGPGDHVRVRVTRGDGHASITVSDDGPGIGEEHLGRIFERFYRVETDRSRNTGGSGLGLAICKHITQQLGGTIDVSSTLTVGTTFRVSVPIDS